MALSTIIPRHVKFPCFFLVVTCIILSPHQHTLDTEEDQKEDENGTKTHNQVGGSLSTPFCHPCLPPTPPLPPSLVPLPKKDQEN